MFEGVIIEEDFILDTDGVFYRYSGNNKPSIDNVTIKIRNRAKTVILGANGAGKSTLFYHFNGIFKPKSGSVSCLGQRIKYKRK